MGPDTPLAFRTSHSYCLGIESNAFLESTKQQYNFCPLFLVCFSRVCKMKTINCAEPSPETTLPDCP